MNNRKFQIGSTKRRYRKSTEQHCFYNRISARLSLAGLSSGTKRTFRWLSKLNWINLLRVTKLIVEIAEKIRSLIFCQQSHLLLEGWVQNKVSIS
jgi:hypothetical protein